MLITLRQAIELAKNYIERNIDAPAGDRYEVIEAATEERDDGWYVFYQAKRFIETGDINYSVVGNWPIFIKNDGTCFGPKRPF